jgi:hypothetical protein
MAKDAVAAELGARKSLRESVNNAMRGPGLEPGIGVGFVRFVGQRRSGLRNFHLDLPDKSFLPNKPSNNINSLILII